MSDELARTIARDVAAMRRDGPHRTPRTAEVAAIPALAAAVLVGDDRAAEDAGAVLGLAALRPDAGTLLLRSDPRAERSWLTVVLRAGVVPELLVEVPHPNADLHTEEVGLAVRARSAGALYVQAGAHRVAGAPSWARERAACPADVSARPDAVFSRLVEVLVTAGGTPQVQLHGFADRPAAGVDVVLSPGAARPGPVLDAVAGALRRAGERVAADEDPRWSDLRGRRNAQGLLAARAGTEFVHVELSRALRRDAGRRERVAAAIAGALTHDGGGVPEHPAAVDPC